MRLWWVMMVLGVVVENRNLWLPKDLPVGANKTMNATRSQAIFKLVTIKLVFLSDSWWLTYVTWNNPVLDAITWTTLDASVSEELLCRYVAQPTLKPANSSSCLWRQLLPLQKQTSLSSNALVLPLLLWISKFHLSKLEQRHVCFITAQLKNVNQESTQTWNKKQLWKDPDYFILLVVSSLCSKLSLLSFHKFPAIMPKNSRSPRFRLETNFCQQSSGLLMSNV